jgi:hypothetical protein
VIWFQKQFQFEFLIQNQTTMEYTKIDLDDGSGAELLNFNRPSATSSTDLKAIKRDTRDLLRLLESTTSRTVGILDVAHSGWVYRKKITGDWKKYFCHLDGSHLYFFDGPEVLTYIPYYIGA